jgi:Ca-activated chloride channel family protein
VSRGVCELPNVAADARTRRLTRGDLLYFSRVTFGTRLAPWSRGGAVVTRFVLLSTVLVLSVAPTVAQQQAPPEGRAPTFRSNASLVALNVTVVDTGAKYVTGLRPADFAVFEDGVRQDVRFFESSGVPVDLIVLIDTSSSMTDKMDVVHDAANGFLATLREGDRGAVIAFSNTVRVLQPLTSDHSLLERAITSTQAGGATALNNALYIALKQFGQAAQAGDHVRRQAIAVLSDGDDTSSLVTFDDVLALARRTGVNIYTVGVQPRRVVQRPADSRHRYFSESDYALKTLARETGAQSFFPEQPADLRGAYASIAAELAAQYSIGYVPVNSRLDGRFRRVVVQVIARPELRPRTRLGYTAEPDPTSIGAMIPR